MNEICKTIQTFLSNYNLNNSERVYIVAFSGGYDSMCLLDSLKKVSKNKIVAIHLNHCWRGEESDFEEQNCKDFCEKIGVDFYSEKLDLSAPHTETFAREMRYKFFEKCAAKFNSKTVFTAHNMNDNAETIIFRIAHGTGIDGLCAISPVRGIYYRPLLNISRKQIENYCNENNLQPNVDSSNTNTKYKRNFIRANIIPSLEQINPQIIETINNLSILAAENTSIVNEYINNILQKISKNSKINTSKYLNLSPEIQKRILYNIITPLISQDYDRQRLLILWKFILENKDSKSGKKCSVTNNLWLFVSDKNIEIINNSSTDETYFHVTKEGVYENDYYRFEIEKNNDIAKNEKNTIYADLSGLDFDFEVRHRQNGDIIQPFGMLGHQKFKKYLNAKKIPNHEKDNLIVFATKNKEILWCCGKGISERIRVKQTPTHIIKIMRKDIR